MAKLVNGIDMDLVKVGELKAAMKAFNAAKPGGFICKAGANPLGSAKAFTKAVEDASEENADDVPVEVVDYYNKIVVNEEEAAARAAAEAEPDEPEAEADEPEAPAPRSKPSTAKAGAKASKPAAAKAKVEKPAGSGKKIEKAKGVGVLGSILEFITEHGPITKEKILQRLAKRYPDRDPAGMNKTLTAQIGGKKRPLRFEKEKKVTLVIGEDGFSMKAGKK